MKANALQSSHQLALVSLLLALSNFFLLPRITITLFMITEKYPIVSPNKVLLSVVSQYSKTKMKKNVNGINIANLIPIFLITHAMIGFASFPPYLVSAMFVVIPSSIGKIKKAKPNPMLLIQSGRLKSERKLRKM